MENIVSTLRETPEENFLIVFCFAGQSMTKAGQHIVLTNEFNEKIGFYEMCFVEKDIRAIAKNYKNSYCIALFACHTEVFNLKEHCGGFSSK